MGWQITVSYWQCGYQRRIGYSEGSEGACSKLTENTPYLYFLYRSLVGGEFQENQIEMDLQDWHGTILRADNNKKFTINPGSHFPSPTDVPIFTLDDVNKTITLYYYP